MTLCVVPPAVKDASAAGVAGTGYAVSDFATGFDTFLPFGPGPVGLAFDSQGNLYSTGYLSGNVYKFPPTGGTFESSMLSNVGFRVTGLAFDRGGRLFVARQSQGDVKQLDPLTGSIIGTVATGLCGPNAVAVDPLTNDLFISSCGTVQRLSGYQGQPVTPTLFASNVAVDGLTFAPDGTLFGTGGGPIYRITGTSDPTPGTPTVIADVTRGDGIALLAPEQGRPITQLVVNTNNSNAFTTDGTIDLVDFSSNPVTITPIVSGGNRGDFVAVGPDKCLYATQSDEIEKVTSADGSCPFIPTGVAVAPTITLAPATQMVDSGVTAAVTATLADSGGIPVPGIAVTFSVVSGPHAGRTGAGTTDASGQAGFGLLNDVTSGGTDVVAATYTDSSGTQHSSSQVQVVMGQAPNPLPGPPGQAMSFTSPDFKIVRYIHTFDKSGCQADLQFNLPTAETNAGLACDGLIGSANVVPPDSFDNSGWTQFVASKQYRAIVHVPALHVTCSKDGHITSFDQGQQVEKGFEVSEGFTPSGNGQFDPAEPYLGSQSDLFGDLDLTLSPAGDAVVVSYITGSRLSTEARLVAFGLLGYDAPYVWTVFRERVTCSSFNVVIVNSDFPTTNMYVDDSLAMFQPQTPRLANFIRSGGTQFHDVGLGNLDPICSINEAKTRGSALVPLPSLNPTSCALAIITENWPYVT
ncbi:MAG: hypothetical protein E6I72_08220 [Chloroflexi bacterium]|nr:MAG: hypothetical protein E6I72_08220 [Chloroflexota bacterium]